ncbi:hypothetical protein ANN_21960 [Periplaneta americana]|uniref:Uncharacterized protein n=1 Tax=Periplaneta americana TaxID=6978 RepID=A0ABQ8S7G2_PERAM|nr:hypothetical protein ANN_21960 [Periplaneta americana]
MSQKRKRLSLKEKVDIVKHSEKEKLNVHELATKFIVGKTQECSSVAPLNTHLQIYDFLHNSDNSILSPRPNMHSCHNPGDPRNYAAKLTGFLEFGKDAATLPPRGFDGSLSILLNKGCDWLLTGEDKISVTNRGKSLKKVGEAKTFVRDRAYLLVFRTEPIRGDNAGEMSPGSSTESYPAFARIGLRKTPEKPQPGNLPRPGFEPGPPSFTARRADRYSTANTIKYLGATVTNINDTQEEIKHRIKMGNACYYSVEKLLSSSPMSKNLKVRIYKTVILPVVLYGCETWTLTLREEHRLRVFENKVLRKIFGAKRDEVTGEWRKLQNTELHALYSSSDVIRNIKSRSLRWAGHVARMGEFRNAYRVLVWRLEGKRPLGRPRRRWEDSIKMDLREVGYDDRDWINLAQDRDL